MAKVSEMSSSAAQRLECAICLDSCMNAVRLNCNHVFCYLCVKGSAQQSNNRCPVCRRPIAVDYFDNPNLIEGIDWKAVPAAEGMQWQYEGRNGWWLYDSRTSRDIEKAFASNVSTYEVLIAGFVYVIDFEAMIQFRRNQPNRIRKIRRHIVEPNATKGVAGLRTNFDDIQQLASHSSPSDSDIIQTSENEGNSEQNINEKEDPIDSNVSNDLVSNIISIEDNDENEENVNTNNETNSDSDVNRLQEIFDESLSIRETYL